MNARSWFTAGAPKRRASRHTWLLSLLYALLCCGIATVALGRIADGRAPSALPGQAPFAEPGLAVGGSLAVDAPFGGAVEWNWFAVHEDAVSDQLRQTAAQVTIAVVDSGADLSVPDLSAKQPIVTHNSWKQLQPAEDYIGHGTFVAALAAGSTSNGEGIAGFGGDANLMVVRAANQWASFNEADVARGIVWAVDHGANVINLSLGGPKPSKVEKAAVAYAAAHGVLLVAATGNAREHGNPVNYPAAYLQPVGSNGAGGTGLAVGASNAAGAPAFFSNNGSWLSLLAPGENIVGPLASRVDLELVPRVALPGSVNGNYGISSGTSFAAPEVTGAAALVWAANPLLDAVQVAEILKQTASGDGAWNAEDGFGVLDVAAATEAAARTPIVAPHLQEIDDAPGHTTLRWQGSAAGWRLTVSEDARPAELLLDHAAANTYRARTDSGHTYTYTLTALDVGGRSRSTTTLAEAG